MQFTCQSAAKNILNTIPEISSIEMHMPNMLYGEFDLKRFPNVATVEGNRKLYVSIEKPVGVIFVKLVRK